MYGPFKEFKNSERGYFKEKCGLSKNNCWRTFKQKRVFFKDSRKEGQCFIDYFIKDFTKLNINIKDFKAKEEDFLKKFPWEICMGLSRNLKTPNEDILKNINVFI